MWTHNFNVDGTNAKHDDEIEELSYLGKCATIVFDYVCLFIIFIDGNTLS